MSIFFKDFETKCWFEHINVKFCCKKKSLPKFVAWFEYSKGSTPNQMTKTLIKLGILESTFEMIIYSIGKCQNDFLEAIWKLNKPLFHMMEIATIRK